MTHFPVSDFDYLGMRIAFPNCKKILEFPGNYRIPTRIDFCAPIDILRNFDRILLNSTIFCVNSCTKFTTKISEYAEADILEMLLFYIPNYQPKKT